MSTLTLELGAELETLDPEDALHIQRAVREMILLAKRRTATPPNAERQQNDTMPSFSMGGFMPGIDPHKLGQLPDDF